MSAPWEHHRRNLRHIYLVKNMKVKDIATHMRITYGFNASEAEYERQFKTWGFRKNLKKEHWKHIIPRVQERKRDGKESEVKFDGVLVAMEKIQKRASSQYGHTTVWEKEQARLQQEKLPPTPEGITIQTPQPCLSLGLDTLPWVKFQQLLQTKVSGSQVPQSIPELQDIVSMIPCSIPYQQYIDAVVPPGKAKDGYLNTVDRFHDSSWDALTLAILFYTNGLISPSSDRIPWISAIIRHARTAEASSLFQILLNTNGPTVDALSEIVFKEALLLEDVGVARVLLDCSKIDPSALLPGPWRLQALGISMDPRHPLEVAIRSKNAGMVQLLLNHHARADELVMVAIDHGTDDILEAVVRSAQVDLSAGFMGLVLLENVLAVERLLKNGISADTCDPGSGFTALIWAIMIGNHQLTELLINEGADVNLPTKRGVTPLHVAAFYNRLEITKLLLDNLVQIDGQSIFSNNPICISTPLQIAVYRNHLDMASLLLKYGADVNASALEMEDEQEEEEEDASLWGDCMTRKDGLTTLMIAFSSQDARMIRLLLDHYVSVTYSPIEPKFNTKSYTGQLSGRSALAEALSLGERDITLRVIELGAPSFPDALYVAAKTADFDMMRYLLRQGVDINHIDWDGTTALTAAIMGYEEQSIHDVCAFLLDRGAEIIRKGAWPTALEAATELEDLELVKFLVEKGADIHNTPDGQFVLNMAIEIGDLKLVQSLVKQHINVNYCRENLTPLHRAIRTNDIDIVGCLVQGGADVNWPDDASPIAMAIRYEHKDIIRFLIQLGARCDTDVVLRSAAGNCDGALFEQIIIAARSSPNFDIRIQGTCLGHPALFTAIRRGRADILETLLGININLRSPCVSAAYGLMCRWRNISLMRRLYSAGAPVNAPKGVSRCMKWAFIDRSCEYSPLYSAAMWGFQEGVHFFFEKRADPDSALTEGHSILCAVLEQMRCGLCRFASSTAYRLSPRELGLTRQMYLQIFEVLIESGTDVNRAVSHYNGRTALQMATEAGNGEIVDLLIAAGADIHAPPAKDGGVTALQAAAIGGYLGIAEKLLKLGAYVDAPGAEEEGRTALEGAAEHGRLDMVQLLLDVGAGTSLSTGKQQYENSVIMARREGHNAVAKLIERHQATNGL